MDSGHTSGPTSRIKGKQKIKECSYMEPACSNIAMQKTVNDHTSYMIRVRTKFKMNGEISEHCSISKCERVENSYTIPEHGGLQGMDRAITTCCLPLNHGAPSYLKVPMHPSTLPMYKETTHIPPGLRPYQSTSIGHGQTRRNDEPSSQP